METRRISIKPDTPELKALCDAIRRTLGSQILEAALGQYVSQLVVKTIADPRFRANLSKDAAEAKATEKQERIVQLRAELAKLEAE